MNRDKDLENLKRKTGIEDFNSVSPTEFETVQELAATDKISKEDLILLAEAMPNFVQLQQIYADTLKATINSAKETQKDALQGISKTLEGVTTLLSSLQDNAETEELRSKIADISIKLIDAGVEISKILHETNKDNNTTWKEIITYTGIGIIGIAGGIAGMFAASKLDKKS